MVERRGGFLITRIKQVGGRVMERILAERGVDAFNGPQGHILYVLWQGDGVPISQLSRETGLAMTSLTSMLDRMEDAGLVRRVADRRDRRRVLVFLTEQARGLERDYDVVTDEMSSVYYKGFSEDEIDQFESYLRRVLANVEGRL